MALFRLVSRLGIITSVVIVLAAGLVVTTTTSASAGATTVIGLTGKGNHPKVGMVWLHGEISGEKIRSVVLQADKEGGGWTDIGTVRTTENQFGFTWQADRGGVRKFRALANDGTIISNVVRLRTKARAMIDADAVYPAPATSTNDRSPLAPPMPPTGRWSRSSAGPPTSRSPPLPCRTAPSNSG